MFTQCDPRSDRSQLQLTAAVMRQRFHPVLHELNIVKNVPCSLANGPQRIRKEVTAGHRMLQCICYTSVVQCEETVVLRSVEMRNFSAVKCNQGNWRNVLHLIFRKLPLDNFPHSVFRKIPTPCVDVVRLHLANVCHHINHSIARHLKLDSVYTSGTRHIILVTPHLEPEV